MELRNSAALMPLSGQPVYVRFVASRLAMTDGGTIHEV
jgi:hypothetical protein